MRIFTRKTLLLVLLTWFSACGETAPEKPTVGKYVLVEGNAGRGPFKAGQDNIWATLELHDGGRYHGEFHIGDDDPPFDGGWYVDGDSIRFSGELENFVGHRDRTGILKLTEAPDTSEVSYSYMGRITPHPNEDTRTPEQKQLEAQQESAAAAQAKAQALAEREQRRVTYVFRWSEQ